MSRGVTRDLSIRAQEQLEKQERLVQRLGEKVDAARADAAAVEREYDAEVEILTYYRNHPALQKQQFEEIVLPLEEVK